MKEIEREKRELNLQKMRAELQLHQLQISLLTERLRDGRIEQPSDSDDFKIRQAEEIIAIIEERQRHLADQEQQLLQCNENGLVEEAN